MTIRELANATAQQALHDMTEELLIRLRTDHDAQPDPRLAAIYQAAERVMDAIEDRGHPLNARQPFIQYREAEKLAEYWNRGA